MILDPNEAQSGKYYDLLAMYPNGVFELRWTDDDGEGYYQIVGFKKPDEEVKDES